ncbi:MAG: restriction endonuclease subunit S [Candidatus Omnitrophota bacterium]|nr:restriction endonuclease subunit S [Candidatus Omnitrophota bacterium]
MPYPTKKLGEICNIVYGFAFKANAFNEIGKGLPVIRIGDVDKCKTNKFFDGKYDKKYLIKKNDILLGLSGSFKANRWEGDAALLNQRVATLRNFKDKITEDFIFYQMPRLFVQFEKTITQLSVKNILTKHLENLKILYPPAEVQKQIVKRLDKIAEAQKLNDELIQKAEELYRSLRNNVVNVKIKKQKWPMIRFGDILDYEQPGKYIVQTKICKEKTEDCLPVLTANKAFILGYTEEKEGIYKDIPVIIFDDFTTDKKFVDFPFKVKSSAMKILKLKTKNANLRFVFETMEKIKFNHETHKRYYLSEYQHIKITFPPLKIQKQIVAKLSAVQDYKKQLLGQKSKLKELFDSVLTKSMKGN